MGDTEIVVTSTQDTNTTPYTTPFETWALFAQWSHDERVRSYFQTNNRSIFYFNSKQPSHTLGHKLSRFMRRSNVAGQWFGRRDGKKKKRVAPDRAHHSGTVFSRRAE